MERNNALWNQLNFPLFEPLQQQQLSHAFVAIIAWAAPKIRSDMKGACSALSPCSLKPNRSSVSEATQGSSPSAAVWVFFSVVTDLSTVNCSRMQHGGLNINSDWLVAFLNQRRKTHVENHLCACYAFDCQLLGLNRGSSQGITSYLTARNTLSLVLWWVVVLAGLAFLSQHPRSPGDCHLQTCASPWLEKIETRCLITTESCWLFCFCFMVVPAKEHELMSYTVKVKALGAEPWCLLCFNGPICFLSSSRSFFGVSNLSEWFSGSPLSEWQSAGLCPTVRLPSERFNRTLFRKVSP